MSIKKAIIFIAVGSAFAATLSAVPTVSAADNPFALQSLNKGYFVADADKYGGKKDREGRCGAAMSDAIKMARSAKRNGRRITMPCSSRRVSSTVFIGEAQAHNPGWTLTF